MPSIPRPYTEVLAEHRRRLARLISPAKMTPLRRMYSSAQAELQQRLSRLGPRSAKFTAHQYRLALGQVRQGQALMARRLAGGLGDLSRDAQVDALRGVIGSVHKLTKHFTGAETVLPIEEAGRFEGVITGRRESLLRAHASSAAELAGRNVVNAESVLSQGLLVGDSLSQVTDSIVDAMDEEWWQAERIARTETAWAYNSGQADGIRDSAEVVPELMMRWVELIDDATGMPFDDRVDPDSQVMHGQVTDAGGVFTFPSTAPSGVSIPPKIMERFEGQTWTHPPMRPHDRAVVAPWAPGWGIPGWRCVGGQRIPIA